MNGLSADIRHAALVYRSTPIASGIAVVALAAAMAFVSAFLSMWSDLSLKSPEGFERGGRLVTIGQSGGYAAADSRTPLTLDMIERVNEAINSLQFAAGVASFPQVLHREEVQIPIQAEAVTRYFSDLEPRLQLGRLFEERDHLPDAAPVVVLSYQLWQTQFGGRADILGESFRISEVGFDTNTFAPTSAPGAGQGNEFPELREQLYRVVGILSPRMTGTFADTTDIWLPYEQAVPFLYGDVGSSSEFELGVNRTMSRIQGGQAVPTRMRGLARLAAGASANAAGNELNARFEIEGQALAPGINLSGEEIDFDVIDGVIRDIGVQRDSRRQVRLFLIGTLLLIMVAACNISLFILARASRRQRELGIRMAVGASTKRLARQLISEAGVLVFCSAVIGVVISLWLSVALRELPFLQQAEWLGVSPLDWSVLGMLGGLMLLLTLLVSLVPILGLKRMGIGASSTMVSARAGWGQRLAGNVQLAMTGVVGAAAAAFAWHYAFYANVDRGFDPEDVLVVELDAAETRQPMLPVERQRLLEVIIGLPSIENASFASYAPGGVGNARFTIVQREAGNYVEFGQVYTDEHYLDVMGIRLLHGTNLDSNEPGPFLGNESYAIGTYGRSDAAGEVTPSGLPVRGIVADVAFGHPGEVIPQMGINASLLSFYPLLLVKSRVSTSDIRRILQERIDAGELEIGIANVRRLDDIANRVLLPDRARMALTAISALLLIVLSAFGYYGTQRYLVTASQREYAIRSALGGGPRSLGRLVLLRGLMMGFPGLVFGSVLAFIAVAWLRDGFVTREVSTATVTLVVMFVIVGLLFAASVGPALQARRTAPAILLRDACKALSGQCRGDSVACIPVLLRRRSMR